MTGKLSWANHLCMINYLAEWIDAMMVNDRSYDHSEISFQCAGFLCEDKSFDSFEENDKSVEIGDNGKDRDSCQTVKRFIFD